MTRPGIPRHRGQSAQQPRRAARRDDNEPEIVAALEAASVDVVRISTPCDLIAGRAGVTYLLEIKNPDQPPSKRKLKPEQLLFLNNWRGQYAVVETVDDALRAVGLMR